MEQKGEHMGRPEIHVQCNNADSVSVELPWTVLSLVFH